MTQRLISQDESVLSFSAVRWSLRCNCQCYYQLGHWLQQKSLI